MIDKSKRLIALEGCPVHCASRMLVGVSADFDFEIIRTDVLADFDKTLFGINELSDEELKVLANNVAQKIADKIEGNESCCSTESCCGDAVYLK